MRVSAIVDMTTAVTVPGAIVIVLVRFAVTKTVVVEIPRALDAVSNRCDSNGRLGLATYGSNLQPSLLHAPAADGQHVPAPFASMQH